MRKYNRYTRYASKYTGIVMAAAALVFTGCGPGNVLKEGEVIGREYDDPDSWWTTMCVAYNSNGWCSVSIPVEEYDDAHWYINIRGYDKDGKEREERHEVTQTLFDMSHNGVYVDLTDQSIVPR